MLLVHVLVTFPIQVSVPFSMEVQLLHVVHFAPYWGLGGVRTLAYFGCFNSFKMANRKTAILPNLSHTLVDFGHFFTGFLTWGHLHHMGPLLFILSEGL